MLTRPLILRFPDGDGGGGAPDATAAPAPGAAPGVTIKANAGTGSSTGPKPFDGGSPAPAKTRREILESHAAPPLPAPPKDVAKPKEEPPKPPESKPGQQPKPATPPDPKAAGASKAEEKPRVNPWKERDKERARAEAAEARIKEFEERQLKEEDRTVLESTRKRNDELENEIRFTNWKKSKDYQKFYEPYEAKWNETANFLAQIPVLDKATGTQRAGNQDDLMELFSLDPVAADARATEMVGGSPTLAARLMAQVDKCKELSGALSKAEEDARTNGKTREEQTKSQRAEQARQFSKRIVDTANEAAQEWAKDPDAALLDIIKPREDGQAFTPDEEAHNALVTRGIEMAKAIDDLPNRLRQCKTEAEFKALTRKAVAFVKRGIHFGALRSLYHKQGNELKAAKAELAKYETTTPKTGGRQTAPSLPASDPRAGRRERLQRYAAR